MQTAYLNLIPNGIKPVIKLSQFDEGREFALIINNGTEAADLSNAAILISGKKEDETAFSYGQSDTVKGQYVISVSNNTVTIRNTMQMAAASGNVLATLTIKKSVSDVSTLNFTIKVQENPLDGVDISDTEIPGIIALADEQEKDAEAWAKGTKGGVPVTSSDVQYNDHAKHWAGVAEQYAQGGLKWKGSCAFANIPTSNQREGDMWNVEDAFITDSRFQEGAGISVKAGTNIAWNENNKWDLLSTGAPIALPTGGIAGQILTKHSSQDQDAEWAGGIYHFATVADAEAAILAGTVRNGATVMVDEIGGGVVVYPNLSDLKDVQFTSLANGQILVWDSTAQKWKNQNNTPTITVDSAISTTSENPVQNKKIAQALANGRITFGVNGNGEFGYKKDGTDTIYPFASGLTPDPSYSPYPPAPYTDQTIINAYTYNPSCDYGALKFRHYVATVVNSTSAVNACIQTFGNNVACFGIATVKLNNVYAGTCPAHAYIGSMSGIIADTGASYTGYGIWLTSDRIGDSSTYKFDAGAQYYIEVLYLEADITT